MRIFYSLKLEEKWQVWVTDRDIFGGRIFKGLIADIFKGSRLSTPREETGTEQGLKRIVKVLKNQ